ncbi:hypothetical protein ACGF0D_42160 [Kitasatospora sp. NPDC048298]|uniref:hypothetical protein n=1 Tax=Kitasatospora sp. NPDC048298 TaxID=3364049 RepID=UPI00371BD535
MRDSKGEQAAPRICRIIPWNSERSIEVPHFYTTSAAEATTAINSHGYSLEGIACWIYGQRPVVVLPPELRGVVELLRLYHPESQAHVYTTDAAKALDLTKSGWQDEPSAGWVYGQQVPGTVQLLSALRPNPEDYFYTTSVDEHDAAVAGGYTEDDIPAIWVFSDSTNGVPFYRLVR